MTKKSPARTSKIDVSELDKKRQEACLSCLECCKWLRFDCGGVKEEGHMRDLVQWYTMRGCITRVFLLPEKTLVLCVMVRQTCQFLTEKGCSIYADRPMGCVNYDGLRDPMMRETCKWKDI